MNNRTFEVELKLKNPDEMLKPNMISIIVMNDFSADSAIVVPTRIIKEDLKGKYVYVALNQQDNMVAKKKYITPGISYQNKTMITEGLLAKEKIITDGYNRVNDGMLINVRN
jgi:multidrug efflux pump subunit AcrA (membrane-fusion protein)